MKRFNIFLLLVFGNLVAQNTSLVNEAKVLPTIDGDSGNMIWKDAEPGGGYIEPHCWG